MSRVLQGLQIAHCQMLKVDEQDLVLDLPPKARIVALAQLYILPIFFQEQPRLRAEVLLLLTLAAMVVQQKEEEKMEAAVAQCCQYLASPLY